MDRFATDGVSDRASPSGGASTSDAAVGRLSASKDGSAVPGAGAVSDDAASSASASWAICARPMTRPRLDLASERRSAAASTGSATEKLPKNATAHFFDRAPGRPRLPKSVRMFASCVRCFR